MLPKVSRDVFYVSPEKWVEIEPPVFSHLEGAFDHLEKNNHTLVNHKKMNFPLVYRQVVMLHISCEFLGPSYKNYLLLRLSAVKYFQPRIEKKQLIFQETNLFDRSHGLPKNL